MKDDHSQSSDDSAGYVRRPLGRDLKESASPVGTRFAIDAVEQAPQGLVKGKIMKRNKFQLKGGSAPLTLVGLFATCWLYPATGLAQREDEARAIADTLTVIAAERNYSRLNCGHFGRLSRLCQISEGCSGIGVPGYPSEDPSFISGRLGRPGPYFESGYVREFTPTGVPPQILSSCDPGSTVDFCYSSSPAVMGLRAFSGTGSGEIYVDPTGTTMTCPVWSGAAKLSFPTIVSPPPGSTLAGAKVTVRWTENGVPVSEWRLRVGSFGEYYDFFLGTNLSTEVAGLPLDGRTVPFRLWYRIAEVWEYSDFVYKAATGTAPAQPTFTAPPPGSTLTGSFALFQWTSNGLPVQWWRLYVGSRPGAADYFRAGLPGRRTEAMVTNLPTDGRTVFVRLWYFARGTWKFFDSQFTAA